MYNIWRKSGEGCEVVTRNGENEVKYEVGGGAEARASLH
jgi:hypothetical protein